VANTCDADFTCILYIFKKHQMEKTILQTLTETFGLIAAITAILFIATGLKAEIVRSKGNWLKAKKLDRIGNIFITITGIFFIIILILLNIP